MIHLIDRRFTKEGALDILVNQVQCPQMYDKCFWFSYKAKGKVEVNVKDNVNDNVKDNVNDNVNDKVNDNVNDNDEDKCISIFSERTPFVV